MTYADRFDPFEGACSGFRGPDHHEEREARAWRDGFDEGRTTTRESLVPSIERALFGCEDGSLIDDEDTSVPVGEYRRLLREVWAGQR